MPTGFEVYNESGILMVSDKLATLQYISKGLATTQGAVSVSASGSLTIPVPQSLVAPVVAIQSYAAFGFYYSVDLLNGNNGFVYNTDASPGLAVAYYIFDLAQSVSAPTYGLELFNESGVRTFTTGTGVANIFAAFTSGTVNLTSGRDYAVITPSFGGTRTQTIIGNPDVPNDPNARYVQEGYQYAGYLSSQNGYVAGVRSINFLSSNNAAPAPDLNIPLQICLVVDVTPFGPVSGAPSLNNSPPAQQGPQSVVSAAISPNTSEQLNGTTTNQQFMSRQAIPSCPSGVTITSRSWSLTDTSGGTWSLSSTNGSSTIPGVTNVALFATATATLNLTISYSNGQSATAPVVNLQYTRENNN